MSKDANRPGSSPGLARKPTFQPDTLTEGTFKFMSNSSLSSISDNLMPSNWFKWSLVTGGAILILTALMVLQGRQESAPSQQEGTEQPQLGQQTSNGAESVQVIKPQRRDMTVSLTLPANISPWQQATLYAKVSGYLKWVGVDKGDLVKEGQRLAVIDAPEVEDQYQQAEADYKIKKLTAERLLGVWQDNPDVIAKQDVDVALAAAEAAKHLRDNRRTLLDYTKVVAPFSGQITARFADPGAMIQTATSSTTQAAPLFTIMDLDTVRVYANIPQEAALLAKPLVPAVVTLRELPGQEFEGSITRTTGALDPSTRTLLVEIDLSNKDRQLQAGMYANVTLLLDQHPQALAIPPASIVNGGDGNEKSVYVVRNGKAHRTPIKTGIDDGLWMEVVSGLSGEEDIVVVGKASLTEGQAVKVSAFNLPTGKPSRQAY